MNTRYGDKPMESSKSQSKIDYIMLFLMSGDVCKGNKAYNYITAFKLKCDMSTVRAITENANNFDPMSCINVIEIKTNLACTQNMRGFQVWYKRLKIPMEIVCTIFISLGFYYLVFSDIHRKESYLISIGLSIFYILKFILMDATLSVLFGNIIFRI